MNEQLRKVLNEAKWREAEIAAKRERVATSIHDLLLGARTMLNVEILEDSPETVMVEFEGECFAINVEDA